MERQLIRPLGRLERLYTARHSLGLYHAVIVTNKYVNPNVHNQENLESLVLEALSRVVSRHEVLRCCVEGEDGDKPPYVRIPDIDVKLKVKFAMISDEKSLISRLEHYHDQVWQDQEKSPPWKLVVFQHHNSERLPTNQQNPIILDVAFIFHHALCDGLSGASFHSCLLDEMRKITSPTSGPRKDEHKDLGSGSGLDDPVENLINFKLSWNFLLGEVLKEYGPSYFFKKDRHFTGLNCTMSEAIPFSTRLRSLEIDPMSTKSLVNHCKAHKVTMTSVITSVLVNILAIAIPEAIEFIGITPYTLRHVSGSDPKALVNQTSAFETQYLGDILNEIRLRSSGSSTQLAKELVWKVAEIHESRWQSEFKRCPYDNMVGLLPYVSDTHEFYRKKLGKKREHTFEVSNLGVNKNQIHDKNQWNIERSMFSQGAAVVGPALTLNCASVMNGPLNIIFTWQDRIIDEKIVEKVAEDMKAVLRTLI